MKILKQFCAALVSCTFFITATSGFASDIIFSDIENDPAKADILKMADAGYLNGMGDGTFNPNGIVTRGQMACIISNLLKLPQKEYEGLFSDISKGEWYADSAEAVCRTGIMVGYEGKFRPNDTLNLEEAAKIFVEAKKALSGAWKGETVRNLTLRYESNSAPDVAALVKRDAEDVASALPSGEYLFREVMLPTEGKWGSSVSWSATNAVIDENNMLSFERTAKEDEEICLTAIIKQGDVTETKEFRYLLYPCGVNWTSIADMLHEGNLLVPTQGKKVSFSFDVIPKREKMNALIGFTQRDTIATSFQEMPIIFRLNEQGYFDCYNGNTYSADRKVTYIAGNQYAVQIDVDFTSESYSVTVTPKGGQMVTIAQDYQFRATADTITSIGRCYLRFGSAAESVFSVSYHSLAAPEEVTENEKYPFDKEYLNSQNKNDFFEELNQSYLTESISLPEYDGQGRKLIWLSSNPSLLDENGILHPKESSGTVTMTAIVYGINPATSAVMTQKNKISVWARQYIASAADMGILRGALTRDDFNPKEDIARSYCAVLMNRMMSMK